MKTSADIHIVFAPDEKFAMPCGVALASVLQHSAGPRRLRFYILESDPPLTVTTRARYRRMVSGSGARLEFVTPDLSPLKNFPVTGGLAHVSPATWLRLLIPDALPLTVERCLWLDGDTVALDDVALLWDEPLSAAVGAVPDWTVGREDYFNAGVLLFNLRRWRELGLAAGAASVARTLPVSGHLADQDVLNLLCAGDWQRLDSRWNIQTGDPLPLHPGIGHFNGCGKPWQFWLGHVCAGKFWRVRWRTPWRWPSAAEWRWLLKNLLVLNISPRKGTYRLSTLGVNLVNVRRGGN